MKTSGSQNIEQYSALSQNELRLLCFLAYYGEVKPEGKAACAYRKLYGISQQDYDNDAWHLMEAGFLSTKSYIKPEKRLDVLLYLYRNRKWTTSFKTIEPHGKSNSAEYLWKIAQLLAKDDFAGASKVTRPYVGIGYKQFNLFKYIQEQLLGDARYIKLLNDPEMMTMVDEYLREKFMNDELDDETLGLLSKAIPKTHKYHDELIDEISAYRYFQTGIAQVSLGKPTMWSMAVEGMQFAYDGQLEESLQRFNTALKLSKTNKNAFPSDIFNYVYGIVICRLKRKYPNENFYLQCFEAYSQSKALRLGNENFMMRILLDNMDKDAVQAKNDIKNRTGYILNSHHEILYQTWALLLFRYFDIEAPDITVQHSAAFFQHELSNYQSNAKVKDFFDSKPLISSLRKKQAWELLLTDISERVSKENKDTEKRLVYYMKGKSLHAIVEQTRKEGGEWCNGRLLSRSQMIEGGYDNMDSADVAIATQLAKPSEENASDADIIVPILGGTDRLLCGNYYEGKSVPMEVSKESPYLEFKGEGAHIKISSNVTLDASGRVRHHIVRMDSPTHFTMITINALQRDILKRFIQMRFLPSSALISLTKAIDSLKGIIDVRALLPEPSVNTAVPGKGILGVRITPEKQSYLVKVSATGMEDGLSRFVPAEGESVVYDEVDGLTHCVHRDLTKEYENFCMLNTVLSDVAQADVLKSNEYRIWSLEGLLHVLSFVFDNKDRFFMEWPEGIAIKLKGNVKDADIDIAVQSDMDWFKVEGEARIAGTIYSLEELINMCSTSTIEGFIRLNDEEYVRISEKLKRHIAMIESLTRKDGKKRHVSKYSIGALANTIDELRLKTDGNYTKFMEKTKAAYAINPEIPSSINATLRDYQKEGFRWMCRLDAWGAGACLADDMGLGKTIQALTFLTYKGKNGASLVVAPKSVVMNWGAEASRFAPQLNVIILNNVTERESVIEKAGVNDLIICTYGLLVTESVVITRKEWNVVCLDESHQIKNRNTIASQTAMDIKSASRLILTGTPLQNNLSELWNQFQFINPGLLGPWPRFRDCFMIPALDNEHKLLLKEITQPFILRRTKQDVLNELPEKLVHTHYVEMTDKEAETYEEMRRLLEIKFKQNKNRAERAEAKKLDLNFFSELMKLRQSACSMRLIYNRWAEQSSKIDTLTQILENITQVHENNILIFSQFTSFLELIKPELKKRNMDYLYLDGQTPLEKRKEIVTKFQTGHCKLFLSSLKAGGLGLNLTAANYVILLDPWWNPAIENQAMDRAHRLGQKRVVSVIRLITSNTIEEKILRLHETKQNLSDDILEGTGESYKLTYEDVMDMVTPF